MEKKQSDLNKTVDSFNEQMKEYNLPEIALVNPKDCIGQEKNARYFTPEVFQQLVDNVKADNRLESVPLVYRDKDKKGKYKIVSGHHRIEAAKQAQLEKIMVFIIEPKNQDEIISKQLSHNSLVGKDDKVILAELFNDIKDIQQKIASGIQSEIDKISYTSLNFKLGTFKELILLFAPQDIEKYDSTMKQLEESFSTKSGSQVDIVPLEIFDKFANQLRKIKKNENIKSNATAFMMMVEIVEQFINQNYTEDRNEK